MLKQIRKNAVRQQREILEGKTVECFVFGNDYKGGTFMKLEEYKLYAVLDDIKEGYAVLSLNTNTGNYLVQYAGKCKWVVQ
ncbi:hypothetical protein PQE71_gp006 [Bacillus phage Izhevsk]|uniref:Uncharacterized protein n=1 Tax=Bacillus phage Izhevsk TaxID=2724322 RepID=A0A6H0X5V1_9CAUD|nr:hypothetical protein PQE71_gp006 [Bacillus phage Izhevsk]QIW89688.1 hypothetical protein Izhevsk_6 [Bacillus phage Izhevsk]